MKFGEKLRSEIVPEWSSLYLDYDKLKNMIKELEAYHLYDTQITDKGWTKELILLILLRAIIVLNFIIS